MKNIFSRLISLLLLLCIVIGCVSSCDLIPKPDGGNDGSLDFGGTDKDDSAWS